MNIKKYILGILRFSGLLEPLDRARFLMSKSKYSTENKAFKAANPGVVLPPDFILYESFGKLNYKSYYNGGHETAVWLLDLFKKYYPLENAVICEWGCGPGRLLRHFPELLTGQGNKIIGTDYNVDTIAWDKKNLSGIDFYINQLSPPLPLEKGSVDILYCISVFTHLSEKMHFAWFEELMRVLKPEGILLFTTHGDSFKDKLLVGELKQYNEGRLVERNQSTEGKRTFTAFQSTEFVKKMIGERLILAHLEDTDAKNRYSQDVWIVMG
jgi:SAM-dependent methyltransferase